MAAFAAGDASVVRVLWWENNDLFLPTPKAFRLPSLDPESLANTGHTTP